MSNSASATGIGYIAEDPPPRETIAPPAHDTQNETLLLLHPDLSRLLRAIRRSEPDRFALYFARCNNPSYRAKLIDFLKAKAANPIVELSLAGLPVQQQTLDSALLARLKEAPPDAVLFVYDLETLLPHSDIQQQQRILLQLNWRRSAFARLRRTLILWLPEFALQLLTSQAPDFADWYSGIYEFDIPEEAKGEILQSSLRGFYDGDTHAAERLTAEEKRRWIETLHSLLDDQPSLEEQTGLLLDLGRIYHSIGDNTAALDTFEKALSLSRQTGNRRRKGTSLNNISQIYDARGDYDKALDFLKQSLAIRQEIGDLAGFCASTINMGHMHWQREEQQEALNAWVGAYLLAQKIGYAQALEALESIGTHLGGEGLEHWERLARQEEKESG